MIDYFNYFDYFGIFALSDFHNGTSGSVIQGLSTASLTDLGKFCSRFGDVVQIDPIDLSSALAVFDNRNGATCALSFSGHSYRGDVVRLSHPSEELLSRFYSVVGSHSGVLLSPADDIRHNLSELAKLTSPSELLSFLDYVVSDVRQTMSVGQDQVQVTTKVEYGQEVLIADVPPPPIYVGSAPTTPLLDSPNVFSQAAPSATSRPPPGFAPRPSIVPLIPEPSVFTTPEVSEPRVQVLNHSVSSQSHHLLLSPPCSHSRVSSPGVRQRLFDSRSCYYCRQFGHLVADCPALRQMATDARLLLSLRFWCSVSFIAFCRLISLFSSSCFVLRSLVSQMSGRHFLLQGRMW